MVCNTAGTPSMKAARPAQTHRGVEGNRHRPVASGQRQPEHTPAVALPARYARHRSMAVRARCREEHEASFDRPVEAARHPPGSIRHRDKHCVELGILQQKQQASPPLLAFFDGYCALARRGSSRPSVRVGGAGQTPPDSYAHQDVRPGFCNCRIRRMAARSEPTVWKKFSRSLRSAVRESGSR